MLRKPSNFGYFTCILALFMIISTQIEVRSLRSLNIRRVQPIQA